jgi:hypothetical protein
MVVIIIETYIVFVDCSFEVKQEDINANERAYYNTQKYEYEYNNEGIAGTGRHGM